MYKQICKNGWNVFISGAKEVYAHIGWDVECGEENFIGRFKYSHPGSSAIHFCNFLVKNFTPQEFFAMRAEGMSPLMILKTKGYLSYNELRCNKNALRSVIFARTV